MRIAIGLLTMLATLPAAAGARRHAGSVLPIGQSAAYRCTDGQSIELLFAGDGSALLTASGETASLKPTDKTGAHFQGGGWRWYSSSATTGWLARVGPAGHDDKGRACAVG